MSAAEVERVTLALSDHWNDMHTNESLGKQRMLAQVALAALTPTPDVIAQVKALLVQLRDRGDITSGYDTAVNCIAILDAKAG